MSYQPQAGSNPFLTVSGTTPVFVDNDPYAPANIVVANSPFKVKTKITFAGSLANFLLSGGMKVSFKATARPEDDGTLATTTINFVTVAGQFSYDVTLDFASGLDAGVYELTLRMNCKSAGNVPAPISGFVSDIDLQSIPA